MDMPRNHFKAALKAGERQIGLWTALRDSAGIEMLAACGYDWLLIDNEHAPITAPETLSLMQAAAPYPVSTVVRPGWNDQVEIKRLLDAGAQTILVPYVQTPEEAEAAVRAMHYPPRGVRGVAGATRASRYGAVTGYAQNASDEICLLVQVETADALERLEDIAAVDGVDGIFIGPSDLAASMGHPGNVAHPEVKSAVVDAIARISKAGLPPGILSLDPGLLQDAADAGAKFIAMDVDMAMLRRAALDARKAWS